MVCCLYFPVLVHEYLSSFSSLSLSGGSMKADDLAVCIQRAGRKGDRLQNVAALSITLQPYSIYLIDYHLIIVIVTIPDLNSPVFDMKAPYICHGQIQYQSHFEK